MRAVKVLCGAVLTLAALGCGVRARPYPYYRPLMGYDMPAYAFEKRPTLVELDREIYVVRDHFAPVYYVEGDYWTYHQGVWYRATNWNHVWEPVHESLVPGGVVHRDHSRYVYYRPERAVVYRAPR